jgi:polysaccharide pyruvyl transferase WcaK-like protein
VVIGNYGADNTGDEAMLAGLFDGLQGSAVSLSVVSKRPTPPAWPRLGGVTWIDPGPASVLRALVRSHGLVVGGGTHFHDDYRPARLARHWWYLLRIVLVSLAARVLCKQVVWLAVGIGPITRRTTRMLTWVALRLCHGVSVRDIASLDEVRRTGAGVPAHVTFDLAALMHRPAPVEQRGARRRLGVSVVDVASSRDGSRPGKHAFREALERALREVLDADPGLDVALLTLRGGSREDDGEVTGLVAAGVAATHPGRVEIVAYDESPYVMFTRIARCDYVVGARYHASMLAFLARVPQIVVAYHRKCADLCREVGLPADACLSVADVVEGRLGERLFDLLHAPDRFLAASTPDHASAEARRSLDLIIGPSSESAQGMQCAES